MKKLRAASKWSDEQTALHDFFVALAVCHTVIVQTLNDGTLNYQVIFVVFGLFVCSFVWYDNVVDICDYDRHRRQMSWHWLMLQNNLVCCDGCDAVVESHRCCLGYEFIERKTNAVIIKIGDEEQTFQILNVNEFNSTRKVT
jgi:hypothetical protein